MSAPVTSHASRISRAARCAILLGPLAFVASVALVCSSPARSSPPAGSTDATAGITASFDPDRLGATGALTITIDPPTAAAGDTVPLRSTAIRLPAGLGIQIPHLRSCAPERLRLQGARGCPAQSLLGVGRALAQAPLGSSLLTESVSLWVFLGPLRNLQPTFEVLAQGYTPFDERLVLGGTVLPDNPPYGEDLSLSIPAISTLPLEPEASIVSMSLTIGSRRSSAHEPNRTIEPSRCPAGGFPFAAQFVYANGSTQDTSTLLPCPR